MKWHWNEAELGVSWRLSPVELAVLGNRTDHRRLGLAISLKFFQQEGHFPDSLKVIPAAALQYLSEQAGVALWEMEQ